jgi:hypothetical protein
LGGSFGPLTGPQDDKLSVFRFQTHFNTPIPLYQTPRNRMMRRTEI